MRTTAHIFRRVWLAWLLGSVVWLVTSRPASARCVVQLQVPSVDWLGRNGAGYDVFDEVPFSQTVNFTVTKRGNDCPYFVTFSKNTPGNDARTMASGGDTLKYQIYDTTSLRNVLKDLPSAAPNEVLTGDFSPSDKLDQLSFVIAIPPLQIRSPGRYTDSVRVSLYQGTRSEPTLVQSVVIQISARVAATTRLTLVPSGSAFDPQSVTRSFDFGVLAQDQKLGCDLRVRSNSRYTVSFHSDSAGVLKHALMAAPDTVPYTFSADGTVLLLRTGADPTLGASGANLSANGDVHPLAVTIGALGNAAAGNYRDVITITVTADN